MGCSTLCNERMRCIERASTNGDQHESKTAWNNIRTLVCVFICAWWQKILRDRRINQPWKHITRINESMHWDMKLTSKTMSCELKMWIIKHLKSVQWIGSGRQKPPALSCLKSLKTWNRRKTKKKRTRIREPQQQQHHQQQYILADKHTSHPRRGDSSLRRTHGQRTI